MKTLKKSKTNQEMEYLRVNDGEAEAYIKRGYSYCPKSEWKSNVRDFGKVEKESKSDKKKSKEVKEI
jgi:hypothetical protein